jgi:hypothetical protein
MGCIGALIGFAGRFTAELVAMSDGVQGGDLARARAIWTKLCPMARWCWRSPIRYFWPRMMEVLRLQGYFLSPAGREPQLGVDDAEREAIASLMKRQGLLRATGRSSAEDFGSLSPASSGAGRSAARAARRGRGRGSHSTGGRVELLREALHDDLVFARMQVAWVEVEEAARRQSLPWRSFGAPRQLCVAPALSLG